MPFQLARPDDDATLRSLLKQAGWMAQVPLSKQEAPDPLAGLLGYEPGLKDSLACVAVAAGDLAPAQGCGIWLLTEERDTLVLSAHSLEDSWAQGARLSSRHGFWKELVEGDAARRLPELAYLQHGPAQVLAAPLRAGTLTLGCMAVFLKHGEAIPKSLETGLIQLAQVAAQALYCALRREVEAGLVRETHTSALVERAVSRIMETQAVAQSQALRVIQKASMDRRQSRRRIAEGLILADAIREHAKSPVKA
jgi:hypothetical protein